MPKEIKLYNTLTRSKDILKTVEKDTVKMYSCGPTVYNFAHIGNLRTYVFMDILRRVLKLDGYKLKSVMNITDVGHLTSDGDTGEDKMAKTAKEQKKDPMEIANFYSQVFFKDLGKLNISRPEIIAKATDHIDDMIHFVEKLIEKGYAYETSDGIYFDTEKFDNYGALSGQKRDELKAGARIEVNSEKKNPRDFAVWKKAEPNHIMQWPSPWGMGYPGWHIECSAMSKKYLGDLFDIHTGGVDHIPVHHENEIAQNEAYAGHKTVNTWMHAEFMLVDNGKMSKSLKNTYTIEQLEEKGYSALDFRYFCLNTHYRKKLNFTFTALDAAKVAYARLCAILSEHANEEAKIDKKVLDNYEAEFFNAINDDLNIPLALGVLWTATKESKSKDIYNLALKFDQVFALSLKEAVDNILKEKTSSNANANVPKNVIDLCEERILAKKNKDFKKADGLRAAINQLGYNVLDTREGYKIEKSN